MKEPAIQHFFHQNFGLVVPQRILSGRRPTNDKTPPGNVQAPIRQFLNGLKYNCSSGFLCLLWQFPCWYGQFSLVFTIFAYFDGLEEGVEKDPDADRPSEQLDQTRSSEQSEYLYSFSYIQR